MFCSNCGTQNSENAKFCNDCGANLVSVNLENEQTPQIQVENKNDGSFFNIIGKFLVYGIIGIILLIFFVIGAAVLAAFVFGMGTQTGSFQNTDIIYNQSVETIILTLEDMPYEWSGSIVGWDGDYYISSFNNLNALMPQVFKCNLAKYNTIEEAKNEYIRHKNEHSNTNLKPIDIGNEGFVFNQLYLEEIVFRKGNVVVKLSGVYTSLDEYAKIVDKKIDPKLSKKTPYSSGLSPTTSPTIATSTPTPKLISSGNEINLKVGESYDIGNEYSLILQDTDSKGGSAWISITKNNEIIEDIILEVNSIWTSDEFININIKLVNLNDNSVDLVIS